MRNLVLFSLLFCAFIACHGQEKQEQKNSKTTTTKSPNENWTVHEEYDDNGNLISKDSTYTYSYSSVNGQEISPEEMDSIFSHLQRNMPKFDDMSSFNFMQNFGEDFFFDPFFDDIQDHRQMMEKIKEMRKMHEQFFQHLNGGNRQLIPRENRNQTDSLEEHQTQLHKI